MKANNSDPVADFISLYKGIRPLYPITDQEMKFIKNIAKDDYMFLLLRDNIWRLMYGGLNGTPLYFFLKNGLFLETFKNTHTHKRNYLEGVVCRLFLDTPSLTEMEILKDTMTIEGVSSEMSIDLFSKMKEWGYIKYMPNKEYGITTEKERGSAMSIHFKSKRISENTYFLETEDERVNYLCKKLAPYFNITREVWGRMYFDDGTFRKKRIDLILEHKLAPEIVFGVEVKKKDYKTGSELAAWVNQARAYSTTEFYPWGQVPVMIYPSITNNYLREACSIHSEWHNHNNNVGSFISQIANVGEIFEYGKEGNLKFVFNSRWLLDIKESSRQPVSMNREAYKKALNERYDIAVRLNG